MAHSTIPHKLPYPRSHLEFTTHPSLHLRDARDAHIILEAVRLNILPWITRRLSSTERENLSSGNVFVWEEAEFKGGLERWCDGRRWSQSRMQGDFLFYEEKLEATQEERDLEAARRVQRALDPLSVPLLTNWRQDRPSRSNGLTKQTFSTQVYLPGAHAPRNDYTRLPTIDDIEQLRNICVPHGIYISSKGSYKRADSSSCEADDGESMYSTGTIFSQFSGLEC